MPVAGRAELTSGLRDQAFGQQLVQESPHVSARRLEVYLEAAGEGAGDRLRVEFRQVGPDEGADRIQAQDPSAGEVHDDTFAVDLLPGEGRVGAKGQRRAHLDPAPTASQSPPLPAILSL